MIDDGYEKQLSAGVIITDGSYILACRPFGRSDTKHNYDLPKGHVEPGEAVIDAAIREVKEETGYEIYDKDYLVDLGRYDYIPVKDIHLFLFAVDALPELRDLKCTTYFTREDGNSVPEVGGYKYVSVEELSWFFRSLEPVIARSLEKFSDNSFPMGSL